MKLKKIKGLLGLFAVLCIAQAVSADFRVVNQTRDEVGEVFIKGDEAWVNGTVEGYKEDSIHLKGISQRAILGTLNLNMGELYEYVEYEGMFGNFSKWVKKDTHMAGMINTQFDSAKVSLQKEGRNRTVEKVNLSDGSTYFQEETYFEKVWNIMYCPLWSRSFWTCDSGWETSDKELNQTATSITFSTDRFSGWIGGTYKYHDLEATSNQDLCSTPGSEGFTNTQCDGTNTILGNESEIVFLDFDSMSMNRSSGGNNRDLAMDLLATGTQSQAHNTRAYIYIPSTYDYPSGTTLLFGASNTGTQKTAAISFLLLSNGQVRCQYDETHYNGNPTKSSPYIIAADAWNYFEYRINSSPSGANDVVECYINGNLILNATSLSFTHGNPAKLVFFGHPDGTNLATGTIYYDELRIAPKYIGGYPQILSQTDNRVNGAVFESENLTATVVVNDSDGDLNTSRVIFQTWDPNRVPILISNHTPLNIDNTTFIINYSENNYSRSPFVQPSINFRWTLQDANQQTWYGETQSLGLFNTVAGTETLLPLNNTEYNITAGNWTLVTFQCNGSDMNNTQDLRNITLYTNRTGTWSAEATASYEEYSTNWDAPSITLNLTTENGRIRWNCLARLHEEIEGLNTSDYVWGTDKYIVINADWEEWKTAVILLLGGVTAALIYLSQNLSEDHTPLKIFYFTSGLTLIIVGVPLGVELANRSIPLSTTLYQVASTTFIVVTAYIMIRYGVETFKAMIPRER